MVTKEHVVAALNIVLAVSEAIRDLGEVPSGHLYANLMGKMNLDQYTRIIETIKRAGMVKETPGHLLIWIGPKKEIPQTVG